MRRLAALTALAIAIAPTTGCATILASEPSMLELEVREPKAGVVVTIEDIESRQMATYRLTPVRVRLNKPRTYAVNVSAQGYAPSVQLVRPELRPEFWQNLIPLGLLSITVPLSVAGGIASGPETFIGGMILSSALVGVAAAGMVIDAQTGHAWRHYPSHMSVELLMSEP